MNGTGAKPLETCDDETLALDYVLGLLDGPDLGAARNRAEHDAAFALRALGHRNRLGLNSARGEAAHRPSEPRPETWEAIIARIVEPAGHSA